MVQGRGSAVPLEGGGGRQHALSLAGGGRPQDAVPSASPRRDSPGCARPLSGAGAGADCLGGLAGRLGAHLGAGGGLWTDDVDTPAWLLSCRHSPLSISLWLFLFIRLCFSPSD